MNRGSSVKNLFRKSPFRCKKCHHFLFACFIEDVARVAFKCPHCMRYGLILFDTVKKYKRYGHRYLSLHLSQREYEYWKRFVKRHRLAAKAAMRL